MMNNFRRAKEFFCQADLRLSSFLLPCLFSLMAGFSEAANLGLLLPLAKGLIEGNFSFLSGKGWFKAIASLLPFSVSSQRTIFVLLVLLVFVTAVSKSAFEYLSTLLICGQIRRFSNNLRQLLYGRFLSFGKLYFDQNSLGVMQQTLIGYTNKIALDLKDYQQVFTWGIQLIIYLGVLLYISPKLTFFVFFIFPILHYSVDWLIKRITKSSAVYADAMAAMSKNAYNTLSSIPLVKIYHGEESEKKRFAELSDKVRRLEFSVDKKQNLSLPMQEVLLLCMILLLMGAIAFLTRNGRAANISSYLVYFYILKKSSNHFRSLNYARASFASSRGLWREILSVMDDKHKYYVHDGKEELKAFSEEIRLQKLDFSYQRGKPILWDCSFSVKKGEMTALVGESGAGKSTLVNLMARLYDVPPGSIFMDGVDINRYTLESYHRKIAFVHQDALILNDSFRHNLLYGLEGSVDDAAIAEVLKKSRLDEFVRSLPQGLDTSLGDRGVRLSGGERQRLSIARAMLKNAEILILDEATSSLDSQTEKIVQASMEELVRRKTTIVIAHRFSTIKHADKIIVMDKGRVLEAGSLKELLESKGKFYELWHAQRFS